MSHQVAGAREVRTEDAFDVGRVAAWLRAAAPAERGLDGVPEVRQFSGGASNLTMLRMLREFAELNGVEDKLHTENFVVELAEPGEGGTATIVMGTTTREVAVSGETSILDAAEDPEIDEPLTAPELSVLTAYAKKQLSGELHRLELDEEPGPRSRAGWGDPHRPPDEESAAPEPEAAQSARQRCAHAASRIRFR